MMNSISVPEGTSSAGTASVGGTATPTVSPPSKPVEPGDLTGTSLSLSRKRRGRPLKSTPGKVTPAVVDQVAAMTAMGVSAKKAAEALNLSSSTINKIRGQAEVKVLIGRLRESIREVALSHIAKTQEATWAWLSKVISAEDPKAFDAITRGLSALEKISSSTSGEARKVEGEITHYEGTDVKEEAKNLLDALLRHGSEK